MSFHPGFALGWRTEAPAHWSPAELSGLAFIANPDNARTLTLVSSTHISQMNDDAGGSAVLSQATDANRLLLDSSTTLGGHVTMESTSTAQSLSSATGGVTGDADHTLLLIARADSIGTYRLIAATGAVGSDSGIGTTNTGNFFWFGGSGLVTPVGHLPDNTAASNAPAYAGLDADTTTFHVFCKIHQGGVDEDFIDGYLVAGPTTVTYSLSAGFGFIPHASNFLDPAHVAHAVFLTRAISRADLARYLVWARAHFALTAAEVMASVPPLGHAEARRPQVVCTLDSQTHGSGAVVGTSDYPTQMGPLLSIASSIWNRGVAGHTIDQADAQVETDVAGSLTALATSNVWVIWGGVNNLTATYTVPGAAAAAAMKLWAHIANGLTYAPPGTAVVVCTQPHAATTPPWNGVADDVALDAVIDTYNGLVRTGVASRGYTLADLAADSRLDPDVTPGNSFDGLHPNASGYAVVASIVATAVNPHLR